MKTIGKDSRKLRVVGALSLFFFIFLGMEYLFVNMMGLVTDASGAVAAQSYILGASVIGFLLFPFINRKCDDNRKNLFVFGMALVVVICIFVVWQHSSYITILFSGCLLYTLLGIVGSMVCYMVVKTPGSEDYLGRIAGMGYALGIFLQFLNNNLVRDDTTESIVLAVAFAVLAVLLLKITDDIYSPDANVFGFEELENQIPSEKSQQQLAPNLSGGRLVHESKRSQNLTENRDCDSWQLKNPLVAGLLLVVIVILMSCIFATLDNAVTLAHAEGSIDVGQ